MSELLRERTDNSEDVMTVAEERIGPVRKLRRSWEKLDVISQFVIVFACVLVIFAYLPTLQFDYVTQDEWRAFRYSTDPGTPLFRAASCVKMLPLSYAQSGRPLVWMTECVEHSVVARISDFSYLRPFTLAIVLGTVLTLGAVLAPFLGGAAVGTAAAAALVVAPGYSYNCLQGMPAEMVLICVILAAISFHLFSRRMQPAGLKRRRIAVSALCFFLSCLMYPAFAFIVVPLAFIEFGFSPVAPVTERFRNFGVTLCFYLACSIFYYIFVKFNVFVLQSALGPLPSAGDYTVSMTLSPSVLLGRLGQMAAYFYNMPPLNFSAPPGTTLGILIIFSLVLGWRAGHTRGRTILRVALFSAGFFALGSIVLAGAISPWLFSAMPGLGTRHLLPWYLFFCAVPFGCLSTGLRRLWPAHARWVPVAAMVVLLLPVTLAQNRLSTLETAVSGVEIQAIRSRIFQWADQQGWVSQRYLLLVVPPMSRPAGVDALLYRNSGYGDDNTVLGTAMNPVGIPWMITALLREIPHRPEFPVVSCADDQSCANLALRNTANVVIAYMHVGDVVQTTYAPYVINLSWLTTDPVEPKIVVSPVPVISASSSSPSLGPAGLLVAAEPGWHSVRYPKYPQTVTIDFRQISTFSHLALLPQDGLTPRMPKTITVMASSDGQSWIALATGANMCDANDGNWHKLTFAPAPARYLKIVILANCGDPNFVTIRGVKTD